MEGVRQGSGFTVKVDPPGLPACLESKGRENAVWFIGPSLSNCKSWNRLGRLCFSSAGLLEAYKQHTLVHPSCRSWETQDQATSRFSVRGEGGGFFFSHGHLLMLLSRGMKDELVSGVLDEDVDLILGSLPL